MPVTLKATGYAKTLQDVSGKLRYYAFRSREMPGEERGLFSPASEHADLRKFVRSIQDDPLLQDRPGRQGMYQPPKMHSLVFSLSRDEFEKSGLTSWKPVVRQIMEEWQRYRGIQVEWVAAEHQSATHPHCHVAIKATFTDVAGNRRRLRLTRGDLHELRLAARTIVRMHRERHWEAIRAQREDERLAREAQRALERAVRSLATGFLDALEREEREQQRAAELTRLQIRRRRRPQQSRGR